MRAFRSISRRNLVAIALTLASFVVLVPGLVQPLITIRASIKFLGQQHDLFTQTRSILQAIRSLHESGNDFVAGLILLFSVLVPFIKGALLVVAALLADRARRVRIVDFVKAISKWAMADVFVVGVYVAFLSAKATETMDAEIHIGFYLFTAYCLLSLLALQFMRVEEGS